MDKVSEIVIVNGEGADTSEQVNELEEKIDKLDDKIDEQSEIAEEIIEEAVSENNEEIKEEIRSWLEKAIRPIAETLTLLSTGLLKVSEKVASMEELLTLPVLEDKMMDMETNTNETPEEILSTVQVESPASVEEENPAEIIEQAVEEVAEAPQKLVREIHKL